MHIRQDAAGRSIILREIVWFAQPASTSADVCL